MAMPQPRTIIALVGDGSAQVKADRQAHMDAVVRLMKAAEADGLVAHILVGCEDDANEARLRVREALAWLA